MYSLFFILFSDLWLDWIKDEIVIATTDEEKENIIKLFEKAVKDYLSNNKIFNLLHIILNIYIATFLLFFYKCYNIYYNL